MILMIIFKIKIIKILMIIKVFLLVLKNNISIYIVEVPNETAPSIQGFAKPPA